MKLDSRVNYLREDQITAVGLLMTSKLIIVLALTLFLVFISMVEEISRRDQWIICGDLVSMAYRSWSTILNMVLLGSPLRKKETPSQLIFLITDPLFSDTQLSFLEARTISKITQMPTSSIPTSTFGVRWSKRETFPSLEMTILCLRLMINLSLFLEVMLKDRESMSAMLPKRTVTPSIGNWLPTRVISLLAFVLPTLQQFTTINATFSVAKTTIIISLMIFGN